MTDDPLTEVYRQFHTAQHKYVYFLLAVAGSGVALAVNQTQNRTLVWSLWPLGVAVLSWALSFMFGCRFIEYSTSSTYSNAQLLLVERGVHPKAGPHPSMIAAASEGIREAIEANARAQGRLAKLQVRMLLLGVMFYIAWHVYEMLLRTSASVPF